MSDSVTVKINRPYPHAGETITRAVVDTGDYGNRVELGLSWEIDEVMLRNIFERTHQEALTGMGYRLTHVVVP